MTHTPMETAKAPGPVLHDDLVSVVYKRIKDLILNQHFEAGQKIKQEELAESLGVSRTTVIKALHLLIADNLVVHTPRKGFTVKKLTTSEMAAIFYIRELLDGAAAREAACKATVEEIEELAGYFAGFGADRDWDKREHDLYVARDKAFHARLYSIAAVPLLTQINEMFNISRVSYQRGLLRDPNETLGEHLAIIEAIRCRDDRLAESLARAHAAKSRSVLLRQMETERTIGTPHDDAL